MKHRKARAGRATSGAPQGLATKIAIAVGAGALVLGAIFWANQQTQRAQPSAHGQSAAQTGGSGKYVYQVGRPGPGE
ncbi:MAG: hypothetical protein ACRDJ9_29205, partial [Dehalococcoidia bacterium]